MANRRRSAEKEACWRRHLEDHAAGGLSIRAYCREHGLSEPSFYVWRREIARRDGGQSSAGTMADSATLGRSAVSNRPTTESRRRQSANRDPSDSETAGLVAVDVVGRMSASGMIEVILPNGVTVRLADDVPMAILHRVLTVTERNATALGRGE